MATYADPNGNGTATAWTGTWTAVDDAVRQPSAPDGSTLGGTTTDEASETLTFTDPAYVAGATYTLWVYGTGGTKRAVDVAYSYDGADPGTGHASRAQLIAAGGAAGWRSRVLSAPANQTELNALRVQLITNSTAGGGGATQPTVDAVYLEIALADADAEVAWSELEVPTAPARADVGFAEVEVPLAPAAAQVAWGEVEVPNAPALADAAGEVAFAAVEVPTADSRADVAWAELELPLADGRAEVGFAELEVPTAAAAAEVGWVAFELPLAPGGAEVAWALLELPAADARADVAFAELELPTAPARADVSFAEFEAPLANARAEVAWAELQAPELGEDGGGMRQAMRRLLYG